MDFVYGYQEDVTAGFGWTCGTCGAWVGAGEAHTCPSLITYTSSTKPYPDSQKRIARALERIADALEGKQQRWR